MMFLSDFEAGSAVFTLAALAEQLATGTDQSRWLASSDWADKHPEQFAPKGDA